MSNELIKIEQTSITSRDIAEITGKMHKHVMQDIRDEINKLGDEIPHGQFFCPSVYTNSRGKKCPLFILSKDGAMQIAARYDAKVRYRLIQKLKELEETFNIPKTLPEALRLYANEIEEHTKTKKELCKAITDRAKISSKREATMMGKLGGLVSSNNRLKRKLKTAEN